MNSETLSAILCMALATYATRLSGLIIGRYLPRQGRLRQALDALPPAILTAVVAPEILSGPAEMLAGATTLVLALRLPLFGAMAAGVLVIIICRAGFGVS